MLRHPMICTLAMVALCCSLFGATQASDSSNLPQSATAAINQADIAIRAAKARYERRIRLIRSAEKRKLQQIEKAAMHNDNLKQAEAVDQSIQHLATPQTDGSGVALPAISPVGTWMNTGKKLLLTRNHKAVLYAGNIIRGVWYPLPHNMFVEIWPPTGNYPKGAADICKMSASGQSFTDYGAQIYGHWKVTH